MARNRKNESGFLPGSVVMALPLLVVLMLSGLGYVWFKDQIDTLGDQVKKKEVTLVELERQNRARRDQLAILCLPEALDRQVKNMNLGLGPPAQAQIIRLTETPLNWPPTPAPPPVQRQAQGISRQRNN
jgi:hypothetical protein